MKKKLSIKPGEVQSTGKLASPYDALLSVIADKTIPTVGGNIQAAVAGQKGVELKSVLPVDETGMAQGGFMDADMGRLGSVGEPRIGPGSQADGRRFPARGFYPGTVTDMPVAQRVKTGRYLS